MSRKVEIRVDGLPPKKDGANSMWGKDVEAKRLIDLRRAVSAALGGSPPFDRSIRLALEVHVGERNDRLTGDLDNFMTGICDGLMTADGRSSLHPVWEDAGLSDIHPHRWRAILDDAEVVFIQAEKILRDASTPWYRLVLSTD